MTIVDRELTQLISAAKHYLDAAQAVAVTSEDLATTISGNQAASSSDRQPHALSRLDLYSAHIASCATRLATIHEILRGGTDKAWASAYPNNAKVSTSNVSSAKSQGLEILLRDYVGHAEDPNKNSKGADFRKAALGDLTFNELGEQLRERYEALAAEMPRRQDANSSTPESGTVSPPSSR